MVSGKTDITSVIRDERNRCKRQIAIEEKPLTITNVRGRVPQAPTLEDYNAGISINREYFKDNYGY